MDYLLASVAVLSALAAVISAALAYQSNSSAASGERDSRVRELSLIANKVVAATIRVDDLGNQLKTAYQSLFTLGGQGAGSSHLRLYTEAIERKQQSIGPMQNAARETLEAGVAELSDNRISGRLLEFDGYLAQLERVKEKFHVDLASVESQILYHQHGISGPGPTSSGQEPVAKVSRRSTDDASRATFATGCWYRAKRPGSASNDFEP